MTQSLVYKPCLPHKPLVSQLKCLLLMRIAAFPMHEQVLPIARAQVAVGCVTVLSKHKTVVLGDEGELQQWLNCVSNKIIQW